MHLITTDQLERDSKNRSGEIYHSILVVEAGGKIDGKIVRQEKEQPTATRLISDETLRPADPELAEIISTYTRIEA